MVYLLNDVVTKMGQIPLEGNIIPNEWYSYLRNEKGKIQTNAALILADLVYWYRPIPIYDKQTGQITGYGKKFKEDLLHFGYQYFDDKFGFSEAQSRSALVFLEEKGLIFREFRSFHMNGHFLNNVMCIGVYPEKIAAISSSSTLLGLPIADQTLPEIVDVEPSFISEQQASPSSLLATTKKKDWSAKFSEEQKMFLSALLSLAPVMGPSIEKDHATWWIKNFGIEKIKIALQVYWQQVEKAKEDSTIPMPQHIGKYVRKALNEEIPPGKKIIPPSPQNSDQGGVNSRLGGGKNRPTLPQKTRPGGGKFQTTNTYISMMSMNINEVNDKSASVTLQKVGKEENKIQTIEICSSEKKEENPIFVFQENDFIKQNLLEVNANKHPFQETKPKLSQENHSIEPSSLETNSGRQSLQMNGLIKQAFQEIKVKPAQETNANKQTSQEVNLSKQSSQTGIPTKQPLPEIKPKLFEENSFLKQASQAKIPIKQNLQEFDWKLTFSMEENRFLSYLLRLKPEKGDLLEESHATWWIKHFGIEKIKVALQVYWQQVEKSKESTHVPMPASMGAYVRDALNKNTQPIRENDHKNKAFAECFKNQMGWHSLIMTEKYCRAEEIGKDWYYHLPESLFVESLKSTFENYYSESKREKCA